MPDLKRDVFIAAPTGQEDLPRVTAADFCHLERLRPAGHLAAMTGRGRAELRHTHRVARVCVVPRRVLPALAGALVAPVDERVRGVDRGRAGRVGLLRGDHAAVTVDEPPLPLRLLVDDSNGSTVAALDLLGLHRGKACRVSYKGSLVSALGLGPAPRQGTSGLLIGQSSDAGCDLAAHCAVHGVGAFRQRGGAEPFQLGRDRRVAQALGVVNAGARCAVVRRGIERGPDLVAAATRQDAVVGRGAPALQAHVLRADGVDAVPVGSGPYLVAGPEVGQCPGAEGANSRLVSWSRCSSDSSAPSVESAVEAS